MTNPALKRLAKIRSDAEYAIRDALNYAVETHKPIYQSCINCEHFDELNGEICKLAKARPPARVIAYGCEQWCDMEIPF